MGEPPTEEENVLLDSILQDCERYDDWWTDRKGGYEVTYRYEK